MMRFILTSLLALLSFPLIAADTTPPTTIPPPSAQNTIIILDGSNSMWGQIDGVNKIVTARDSLRTLIEHSNPNIKFGLLVYGKKGCNDVKISVEPQNYDKITLLKEVYRLNPNGRSPIGAALEKAASVLPEEGGHILLVSDGQESCDANPCEIAAKLTAQKPQLRIDVMGFREAKEAELECIAENGRGAFVYARDAERLKTMLAGVQSGLPNSKAGSASSVIDPNVPGRIEMSIQADSLGDPLRATYSIYTPKNQHIATFTGRNQVVEYLRPGNYRIKAIWQNYEQSENITIKKGETTSYTFNVGATGLISAKALGQSGQPLQASYSIYSSSGKFINSQVLQEAYQVRLPVGKFRLKATVNNKEKEAELQVSANGEVSHTFEFTN
ncbi:vWA domain-containing protein [Thiolinea disciformis]|uniref:vWA domain-containing protein n=1 Tax=Thiolinea disciformis TaxID=125614 RepID=UPI0003750825|nr:VWA domain-containing protein [Thiolinea disciformis]